MSHAAMPTTAHTAAAGMKVYQLFDGGESGSSTFTYLLACDKSRECVLIDPVLEQVDRDSALIDSLGLTLKYALNTHCHADHITGTGQLKVIYPFAKSMISEASGAKADILLSHNQIVFFGRPDSQFQLQVLATPGHTNGCLCYYSSALATVFTGDTLMVGGCGRTDFQEGSSTTLFDSVHNHLFTLPPSTTVLPAHDYKGETSSTIGAEKDNNPRLSSTKQEFIKIMEGLNLSYPGKIDTAVPANMQCGLF